MTKTIVAVASTLVLAGACKEPLGVQNEDAPVLGAAVTAQNLIGGVVSQGRVNGSSFAYLLYPAGMARNSLRPDPNEPRYISELIAVPIDPSDFIGGSGWTGFYQGIRSANQAIVNAAVTGLQAPDRNAAVGLLQTLKALEYIRMIQLRDSLGGAIQLTAATPAQGAPPDPIRTKQAVLAYASAVLDSGYAALTASGVSASVPVSLPSGYSLNGDFTSTANLALFNRGLKGEAEVYRALDHQSPCASCAQTAITALTTAINGIPSKYGLAFGPYYEYNPNAPESFATPLADIKIYLTDNFAQSIQPGDARSSKIYKSTTASQTPASLSAPLTYKSPLTDPANQTRPIPIRRAALWYLLRAQAEVLAGQFGAATADINVVHTGEGGLTAIPSLSTAADARAAILYEYRYSFIFEGPYYLGTLRAYSALTQGYVSQPGMPSVKSDPNHANDPLQTVLPIPRGEQVARNGDITPKP